MVSVYRERNIYVWSNCCNRGRRYYLIFWVPNMPVSLQGWAARITKGCWLSAGLPASFRCSLTISQGYNYSPDYRDCFPGIKWLLWREESMALYPPHSKHHALQAMPTNLQEFPNQPALQQLQLLLALYRVGPAFCWSWCGPGPPSWALLLPRTPESLRLPLLLSLLTILCPGLVSECSGEESEGKLRVNLVQRRWQWW